MSAPYPKEFGGRFVVVSALFERPSSTVFKATDRTLSDREVALKVFVDRADKPAEYAEAFEKELTSLRGASHPALVPILAGGEQDGFFYIAMELLAGPILRDLVKEKNGPFEVERAVAIISALAEAVGEIHEQGAYHGHIDARAIIFKGEDPRLAGFYLPTIERIHKSVTSQGRMLVDPTYIAPEQIESSDKVDGRADIYSLSVLLYELVTGTRPFASGSPLHTAMLRLSTNPQAPAKIISSISPLLDAAILRGLSKDPNQRFQNVAEFVDAITGGKKKVMNPLAEAVASAPDRISTETIAVSMSTDAIKEILKAHDPRPKDKPAPTPTPDVSSTLMGQAIPQQKPMDVAATMMGADMSKVLKASFMIVNGAQRGTKFVMDKAQVIIGSDPSCDVVVNGKDVPRRLALVAQRGSSFVIEAMAKDGVTVRDKEVDTGEEATLTRGDIIHAGDVELRFIAPGEVFTLEQDVADRSVDRPVSRLPKIILGGLVVIFGLVVGGYYMYMENTSKARDKQKAEQAQQKKKVEDVVKKLLMEGDEYFKNGAYSEPVGANAKERFQQVLDLDSENNFAKRRLAEIKEREQFLGEERVKKQQSAQKITQLLADGERYLKSGDLVSPPGKNAREMFQEVLKYDSTNAIAKKKVSEIDSTITDMLGQVAGLMVKAHEYAEAKQFVLPKDENAYDVLQKILKIDPTNEEANELLYGMAAQSIYEGDKAKGRVNFKDMKRSYLTAKALGVDPDYISELMEGTELMGKSKSAIIISDRGAKDAEGEKKTEKSPDRRYLTKEEIQKRVAELELQSADDGSTSDRTFLKLKNNAPKGKK